jgi:hypothetical protein
MRKLLLLTIAIVIATSCEKSIEQPRQKTYKPKGFLGEKTYNRLNDQAWLIHPSVYFDTSGTNLNAIILSDTVPLPDSVTCRQIIGDDVACKIKQYGFTDEYTGEFDAYEWSAIRLNIYIRYYPTNNLVYAWYYKPTDGIFCF